MSRWFRFYADAIRNPKVIQLSDRQFRLWVNLLCVACDNEGSIPPTDVLKVLLGVRMDHLTSALHALIEAKLIWPTAEGFEPDDWSEYSRHSGRLTGTDWAIVRLSVFQRDEFTCRYCGESGKPLECDHVFPVSRGGSNDTSNLVTACRTCNRTKADKTLEELGWEL